MFVALFFFPPTNQALLIVWMFVMYGGIVVWMKRNQSQLDETVHYPYEVIIVKPPVDEFFDDDRVYLQQLGTEIVDDDFRDSPHEAA